MCPRVSVPQWNAGDMEMETFLRIGRYFPYVRVVYLSGWGEPLLNRNILDMIRVAKRAGCTVGFTTNGILLNEQLSREVIRLKVDMIGLSIDGAVPETYESIRVGAEFSKVIRNVKVLSELKRNLGASKPEIVLTFLMMKKNIEELPLIIDLACDLGVDRVVATNLDCVMKPFDEEMHLFSCNGVNRAFMEKIKEAERRAAEHKIPFYAYPIKLEPTVICSADPLRNIFFTWDGLVAPCVYAAIPVKDGLMPRIFCGKRYTVPRLIFGNIMEKDLFEIWNEHKYQDFRRYFTKREAVYSLSKFHESLGLTAGNIDVETHLKNIQLPEVCKTCYKAYGV